MLNDIVKSSSGLKLNTSLSGEIIREGLNVLNPTELNLQLFDPNEDVAKCTFSYFMGLK